MSLLAVLLASYLLILLVLFIYGNNCLVLAYLYRKRKKEKTPFISDYPVVTVQLPVYNELYVVERLIRKVAEMDYPMDKMEIQVLDDSTDETKGVAEKCVDELRSKGYSVQMLHRTKRDGYKAGALREGLACAKGEFIAVFDADFLPDPSFLKRCLPYFLDPSVGMVQTRWGHVNEDYSLLTRALSIGIDGHFQIEQSTRYSAGLFLNFNGTAGVWRKQCILDSGGWQDDTLTEDLDLSYRAQLRGWRLVFLDDVVSPAEVPVQINAFKRQQFRWAKGSIQCAKKLLPRVARAKIPAFKKMEALLHLTYYSVHPMMVALLLLTLPLIFLSNSTFFVFRFFALGTFGPLAMYALSQKELYEGWKSRLKYLPMLTVLGVGISVNNTRAVFEALLNKGGVFQRTPKFGIERSSDRWDEKKYRLSFPLTTVIEAALGVYALVALYYAFVTRNYFLVPFLALYALGYFYVSGLTIAHSFPRLRLPSMYIVSILAIAFVLRLYRAAMGDLSEDPYHHWLVSSYLAYGGNYDVLGAMELHLPGYHVFASGIVLMLGRNILWLKFANIVLSLGSIYLAYLIAGRYSTKAGLLASAFLALNPFEILTSSTSYTEPLAVFAFLLAVYLPGQGKEKAASIALLLASVTRYEVWLALPFLSKKRLILPLVFILAWFAYKIPYGFFPESILLRSREVLDFEVTSGAVHAGALFRTLDALKYFFISSPLVYSLGIYFAVKNIRKALPAFALFNLAAVFLATASGIMVGSFRYFSLAIPLLCIFTGIQLRDSRKLACVVLASLVIALPFYFSLYAGLDALYKPSMRAGEFLGNSGAKGVISNSPVPLYYSGLSTGHLLGTASLKGMDTEQAVGFLEKQGINYLVYVDSPRGELDRVFPGVERGENTPELALAYNPNGWEEKYGAKKAYVYRLRSDGLFKTTGSYISSSPLMADMDGDGFDEIIAASDKLYVWKSNGSQLPGFPAETEGLIASTPGIGHTKSGSVIFVGSDDNRLYAWWYNGSSISDFPKTTNGDVFSKPLLIDMDGDGSSEVIVGSDDGDVYAWRMNGSTVTGWPVKTQGYVSSSPAAADIDGDGEAEIFAGSWDKNLYAWHANGSLVGGFPLKTGSAIWATPRIADLDSDGSKDIIAASDMVYAWDIRGELLRGFPLKTGSYIVSSPLVQDIDNDGTLEIVVASDSLYVYDSNGILKQGWPVHTGYYFWASPFSGDLDGDGMLEIVIGDWSGNVYAFKPDGSILRGFPKHTGGRVFASAAVKDIDEDGTMEMVAGSWDKNIYLWSIDSNGSYRMEDRENARAGDGFPLLKNISFKQENNVSFLYASFSGRVEKPLLNYYGDDGTWHPSPMVLSEGMHVGMIAPQRQGKVKYYITLESGNTSYRFPEAGSYEFKN